jgi:hypothetical protein
VIDDMWRRPIQWLLSRCVCRDPRACGRTEPFAILERAMCNVTNP